MSDKYILDANGVPQREPDLMAWGRWMEDADDRRRVALDRDEAAKWKVSTVFLGLDHQFGRGAPLLYETMVFGGPLDGEQDRYSTRDEAERGHQEILARVKAAVAAKAEAGAL